MLVPTIHSLKVHLQTNGDPGRVPRKRVDVLVPTSSEHCFFIVFVDSLLAHFWCRWLAPFGSMLAPFWRRFRFYFVCVWLPFGILLGPCWSIRLRFYALKTSLRPTTPPRKSFIMFLVSWLPVVSGVPDLWGPCFDSSRCWIILKWISADL